VNEVRRIQLSVQIKEL